MHSVVFVGFVVAPIFIDKRIERQIPAFVFAPSCQVAEF